MAKRSLRPRRGCRFLLTFPPQRLDHWLGSLIVLRWGPQEGPLTRKRHTEKQIIAVLKNAQAGIAVHALCCKRGISDATD